jgi:hypothetical protein
MKIVYLRVLVQTDRPEVSLGLLKHSSEAEQLLTDACKGSVDAGLVLVQVMEVEKERV